MGAPLDEPWWLRPSSASAQAPDPRLIYRTLRTAHFEITFHEPLEPLAQRLATSAEHAHDALTRALGYATSERTLILLTDDTDDANGSASVLPRNEIHLFAAAPDDLSAIADHDDWATTLVIHEHTHILHLNQIGGVASVVNALLGKTMAPNAIQPRWFIEGLATYAESKHSSGGRMRSTLFDMLLRMDVLQDRVPTLAQLSNDPVRWPHGELRYLYGSRFLAFIAERHGDAALARMGREYGRQLVPYGLNRIARRATGHTFVELYDAFRRHLKQHYALQRRTIEDLGIVEGRALAPAADVARSPRYLHDGRVLFYRADGRVPEGLRIAGGETLTRTAGEASLAPHPDGHSVIYSQRAPHRDIYAFHDLFRLDLRSGDSERLSHGLRAREPDVSPDGREVAFVTQASGTSHLEIADLEDIEGSRRTLFASQPFEQVFTPRFSPNGRSLVVSAWRAGGYRDILLVDRATGAVRELTHDRAQDTGPTWSKDGQRVYFSSDRSGVANIYAIDLRDDQIRQITNVIGGAYQPDLSHDGEHLVYVSYASTGFGLHELALADGSTRPAAPYRDTRPAPAPREQEPARTVADYDPAETLLPRSYQLDLREGAFGAELALEIRGNDLARFHDYSLRTALSFERGDPSLSLRYAYGRFPLRPSLRLFREVAARYDFQLAGIRRRWIADSVGAQLALSYRFPSILRAVWLDLDYSLEHVDNAAPFRGALDPNDPPPVFPQLGFIPRAGLGFRYSDAVRLPYDISVSSGRTLALNVSVTDPIMGRDIRSVSVRWSVRQFLPMPIRHHVLALRYAGGQSAGDPGRVGYFVLGGFPDDSPFSLYDFIVFGAVPTLGGEALRGYPAGFRVGPQLHHAQIEYRLPLFDPEWGIYTLPHYVRRVWGAVFSDIGNAYAGRVQLDDFLVGAGLELYASLVISYRLEFIVRLGVAHGFSDGGEDQFYLHLGSPF